SGDCLPEAGRLWRRLSVAQNGRLHSVDCPFMSQRESDAALAAHRPAGPPVFRARGVTKVYGEGEAAVHALAGVDLDCRAGEFLVVLGASGSGKSTLLNLLGGLDTPTAGTLHYQDWDLGRADETHLTQYRRLAVGFVFQFYNLIP